MNKRYIVKKITEKKRGQDGTIDMWYVYDVAMLLRVTGTTPLKQDAIDIANCWNNMEIKQRKVMLDTMN